MVMMADEIFNGPRMERSSMTDKKRVETKRISVSEKRQITIPKSFYEKLGIDQEVICELRGNEIVLRAVPKADDFSEEILKDLVGRGFEGQDLIKEFQKRKSQIRPAVEKMIAESKLAAQKIDGNGDEQTKKLFGDIWE